MANSCLYRRVTVQDSSTPPRLVYDSSPAFSHDICPLINEVPRTLNPGEVFIDRFDWDQRSCARADKCPGDPVPPGTYTVQGHWEQGTARPATFQVATGSPSTTAPPPAP